MSEDKNILHEEHDGELRPRRTLGQYRIVRLIGKGGMAEVYLAEHVQMRKRYALKVLPRRLASDAKFVSRFRVEARVMADLEHPNIVRVHYMGEQGGWYYLVMDYVEGPDGEPRSLLDELKEHQRLPEERVRHVALQICAALAYAHSFGEGVAHRDLKPSNVLLDAAGDVRIADFGIVKLLGPDYLKSVIGETVVPAPSSHKVPTADLDLPTIALPSDELVTVPGLGSSEYMSPEQREGGPVGPRSDIYSFGVLLYGVLTGRKPHGRYRAPSRYGVRRAWNRIVRKCMRENPEHRYASADAVRLEIERVGKRGNKMLALAAALVLLCVFAGTGILARTWWVNRRAARDVPADGESPPPPPPIAGLSALGEIERQIEDGQLEEAERALRALRAREPANPKAAQLEQALAQERGERSVRPVKTAADLARGTLHRRRLDRGQGFASKLAEVEGIWRKGNAAFDREDWDAALKAYHRTIDLSGEIMELESQRQQALRAKRDCWAVRRHAETAKAKEYAAAPWGSAESSLIQGDRSFERGSFESAREAWENARVKYGEASGYADAMAKYHESRAEFRKALEQEDVNALSKYAGGVWKEIERLRTQGDAASQNPAEGRKAYQEALKKLPAATTSVRRVRARAESREVLEKANAALIEARSLTRVSRHGPALLRKAENEVAAFQLSGSIEYLSGSERQLLQRARNRLRHEAAKFFLDLEERDEAAVPVPRRLRRQNAAAQKMQQSAAQELALPVYVQTRKSAVPFCLVPMGTFTMGSPGAEKDRDADERQHQVKITGSFYMSQTEITQGQWQKVMGENPAQFKGVGANAPVETVSWKTALEFCAKFCALERVPEGTYRLPTEAEWEYACRAGTQTPYYWGSKPSVKYGNLENTETYYWNKKTISSLGLPHGSSCAVAQFAPNNWLLYDMAGNVWEWCSDLYGDYATGELLQDPTGAAKGSRRVCRGGSWKDRGRDCRAANRHAMISGSRSDTLGIRLVRVLGP